MNTPLKIAALGDRRRRFFLRGLHNCAVLPRRHQRPMRGNRRAEKLSATTSPVFAEALECDQQDFPKAAVCLLVLP